MVAMAHSSSCNGWQASEPFEVAKEQQDSHKVCNMDKLNALFETDEDGQIWIAGTQAVLDKLHEEASTSSSCTPSPSPERNTTADKTPPISQRLRTRNKSATAEEDTMQHHKEDANQNQRSKDKKQSGDGTSTPDPLSSAEVTVLENLIKLVDFLTSTNDDVIKEFEMCDLYAKHVWSRMMTPLIDQGKNTHTLCACVHSSTCNCVV